MGRHTGPVCRLCRREGLKLFLKGTRCDTPKCAVERRDGVPGMHQFRRGKASEYSIRLREKQKVKRYYGVFERQFRKYFEMASRRRQHRRRPDVAARAPARQRRHPARLRHQPGPGPADHRPRPRHCQRPQARHPQLPGPPRRHDRRSRTASTPGSWPSTNLQLEGMPPVPDWLDRVSTEPARGPRQPPARPAGHLAAGHAAADRRVAQPLIPSPVTAVTRHRSADRGLPRRPSASDR